MNKYDLFFILRSSKDIAELRLCPGKTSQFEAGYELAIKQLFREIKEIAPEFYKEFEDYLNCTNKHRLFDNKSYEPLDI